MPSTYDFASNQVAKNTIGREREATAGLRQRHQSEVMETRERLKVRTVELEELRGQQAETQARIRRLEAEADALGKALNLFEALDVDELAAECVVCPPSH